MTKQFKIGIVGGMGPMAGVLLQKLIIELTPAGRDQEHIPVVCVTNPQIPDRTESLVIDNGEGYARGIVEAIRTLEGAGVDVIAIPCNTAHARFSSIQNQTDIPIVNMVECAVHEALTTYKDSKIIAVLGTEGLLRSRVYEEPLALQGVRVLTLSDLDRNFIANSISSIKAGMALDRKMFKSVIGRLASEGAEAVILGCTEFSLYQDIAKDTGIKVIDPLLILAENLVVLHSRAMKDSARLIFSGSS